MTSESANIFALLDCIIKFVPKTGGIFDEIYVLNVHMAAYFASHQNRTSTKLFQLIVVDNFVIIQENILLVLADSLRQTLGGHLVGVKLSAHLTFVQLLQLVALKIKRYVTRILPGERIEGGVVQIVDMTIGLSPAKVVFDRLSGGVDYTATIECWYLLQRTTKRIGLEQLAIGGKILVPIIDKSRGECGRKSRAN